jgi:hypothetical protein
MSLSDFNLSVLSKAILLILIEITFRLYFIYYYFFTATIQDNYNKRGVFLA